MDFALTAEQEQLRDTLRCFVTREYGFDRRRAIAASPEGMSPEIWHQFAELGLLALGIPEALGGLGGGPVDTMLVMEELGRGLVLEPYLSTAVLGTRLLVDSGSAAQHSALLAPVAAGRCRLALAHDEPAGRYDLAAVATRARRDGGDWVLDGAKAVVLDGAGADWLIVSARPDGAPDSLALFLVPQDTPGLERIGYRTQDGGRAADLVLRRLRLPAAARLGAREDGLALVEDAVDQGIAALCAEAVGAMAVLFDMTLDYVKARRQFGVPIGSFQVVQHRMADMLLELELARSMSTLAAARLGAPDRPERRRAVSAAKYVVGRAARCIGQEAVQLHGGMGVTDELAVSHYFKRLTMINANFGDMDHHLAAYSDLMTG